MFTLCRLLYNNQNHQYKSFFKKKEKKPNKVELLYSELGLGSTFFINYQENALRQDCFLDRL